MIEQLQNLESRVLMLEEMQRNSLRIGTVVGRDEKKHTCRVEFKDNNNLISYPCQVVAKKAKVDKEYWLPNMGELVLCAFLPFGHEIGFVIGSLYNKEDAVPEDASPNRMILEAGQNQFLMDREKGKIRILTNELHVYGKIICHEQVWDKFGRLNEQDNDDPPSDF